MMMMIMKKFCYIMEFRYYAPLDQHCIQLLRLLWCQVPHPHHTGCERCSALPETCVDVVDVKWFVVWLATMRPLCRSLATYFYRFLCRARCFHYCGQRGVVHVTMRRFGDEGRQLLIAQPRPLAAPWRDLASYETMTFNTRPTCRNLVRVSSYWQHNSMQIRMD